MTRSQDRNERQQQDRQRQLSSRDTGQTKDAVDPNAYRLGQRDPLRGTVKTTSADGGTRQASTTYNSSQPTGKVLKSQAGAGKLVLDGPNVRKRPAALIEEEVPVVYQLKWLLTTVTTNSLIVRIGGYKETPKVVLTLPFGPSYDYTSLYPKRISTVRWVEGVTYYFGFKLDLIGPGENDWIVSYGTFELLDWTVPEDGRVNAVNVRKVTLYRVSANTSSVVYQETLTGGVAEGGLPVSWYEYDFYPAGYGNWIKYEDYVTVRSIFGDNNRAERTETLFFNGAPTTTAFWSEEIDVSIQPTQGDSIVANGQTRANTGYYTILSPKLVAYYGYAPLISRSGFVGLGIYDDYNEVPAIRSTYFVDGGSTVYSASGLSNPENLIDYFASTSVLPIVQDTFAYLAVKEDGTRFSLSNSEWLFSGTRKASIHRWSIATGIASFNVRILSYFGFTLPTGEADIFAYARNAMQIQYYETS